MLIVNKMKRALITGITGQDGAYLAQLLLEKKYKVYGTARKTSDMYNLRYLGILGKIKLEYCNLLNFSEVQELVRSCKPDEIYNLAAISSVGQSFSAPFDTVSFNTQSVLNLLESVRLLNKKIKFYQASSSEMFGKVKHLPINENTPLNPLSPYAASKASAHMVVESYRQAYGLFAVSGVLFNHESFLRKPNFFIKKVISQTIAISQNRQKFLEVGNVNLKRDFGYSPKYVDAMWRMMQAKSPKDYLICSGKSVKLKDIIVYVFNKLGVSLNRLKIRKSLYRPAEIMDIYGSPRKATKELGWDYRTNFLQIIDILIKEELDFQKNEQKDLHIMA